MGYGVGGMIVKTYGPFTSFHNPDLPGVISVRDQHGSDWYKIVHGLPRVPHALIMSGKVDGISQDPTAIGVKNGMTVVEISGRDCELGWTFDGTSFSRPAATSADITIERDRRLKQFRFDGKVYDYGPSSRENITTKLVAAQIALLAGKQAGDLRWSDPDADCFWIAADNSRVSMDAQTMIAFGLAADKWKSDHMVKARLLKDMSSVPANYTDNSWWPS